MTIFSTEMFDLFPYGIILLEEKVNEDGDLELLYKYQNKVAEEYIGVQDIKRFKEITRILNAKYIQNIANVPTNFNSLKKALAIRGNKETNDLEIKITRIPKGIIISLFDVSPYKNLKNKDNSSVDEQNGRGDMLDPFTWRESQNSGIDSGNKNNEYSLALDKAKLKIKELEEINRSLKNDFEDQYKELADKNKLLLKVNNDLDNFVYTASHDLKSPILNIEGLINALIFELPDENSEVQHIISLLSLSLNKFKSLLHDLSEIAQVQKNNEDDQLINFFEFYQDIKFGLHEEIIKYGAVVDADFSKAPEIYFSRKNMTSIITNLFSNALKYSSPSRMPEIFLSTYRVDEFVVLSIKDNGLGIKPEDYEKIFSVFKRIYTHVSGSGVGLFIVKRIVDNNGGKIEIESEINKGTRFKIFLRSSSETPN